MHKPYNGLKSFMILNNITNEDMTNVLNMKADTLRSRINGKTDFTLTETEKICQLYKIKPSQF